MDTNHTKYFICGSPLWDNSFWLNASPQLSQCFRQTILVAISPIFLLLLTPFDFRYFCGRNRCQPRIKWSYRNISSMVLTAILILISFVHLLLIICKHVLIGSTVYEPVVDLSGYSMALVLQLIYKRNGRRISIALQIYWISTTILSIIRLYFVYISTNKPENSGQNLGINYKIIYSLYITISMKLFILSSICDKVSNRRRFTTEDITEESSHCALENNTAFSRLTLFWLFRLSRKGFREKIETKDLNELCFSLKAKYVTKLFEKLDLKYNTNANQSMGRLHRKHSKRLFPVLWSLCCWTVLITILLQGIQFPARYAQPVLINRLLDLFGDPSGQQWQGLVYACAYCLTGVVSSVILEHCEVLVQNLAIRCKSALTCIVFKKIFRLSPSARKEYTSGEIVNLMAVDCQEIYIFISLAHYLHIVPISLIIGFCFLWSYLGVASLGCLIVMGVVTPVCTLLGKKLDKLQKQQMTYKDQRMAKISEILNSIKIIKLNAWELAFSEMVAKLRAQELTALQKLMLLFTVIDLTWLMAPVLVAGVCFSIYAYIDYEHFNATTIFVSLATLNILRAPMALLPMLYNSLIRAIVSHRRLTQFLNAEELDDYCPISDKNVDSEHSIRLEKASFSYCLEEPPVLNNITLEVPKGSLVAIVGEVGAGKSSFLSALIGNLYKTNGEIELNGTVGYVPQTAWIQNMSLKNNIVFMSGEDEHRYQEVLDACALLPDLRVLPAGDLTEIGEKGINLSGGQKQRVSLARAVYRSSDIYLLDDPLSAVDAHVAKHLFDRVIGPHGLLGSKTRILCTHNLSFLQNCDQIYVLSNGCITAYGDYTQLSTLGLLSRIEISQQMDSNDSLNEDVLKDDITIPKKSFNRLLSIDSNASLDINDNNSDLKPTSEPLNANIIEEEYIESGGVRWRDYGRYVVSTGTIGFIVFVILRIGYNGSDVAANLWLSRWSNRNNSTDTSGRIEGLITYCSLILCQAVAIQVGDIVLFLSGIKASKAFHKNAIYGVLRSPLSFFDKTPVGRVLNRFSRDICSLDEQIPFEMAAVFSKITWFPILYMLIIFSGLGYLSLALLPITVAFYAIYKFYLRTCRQIRRLESVNNSPVQSHFCECIAGADSIRAFGVLPQFIVESNKRLDMSHNCLYHRVSIAYWLRLWVNILSAFITLLVAVYIVLNRHQISIGMAGLLLTYALQVVNWLTFTIRVMSGLETDMISVERLREFCELSPESDWDSTDKYRPADDWPQYGRIEYKNYSTTYRPGLPPVLRKVSFVVKPGEKVGVCGRTGAGKSSLALSLFRIIESTGGQIVIDGLDIKPIGLHDLRSRLTIIPQDPILFADTLRINLDPFDVYSDDQLWTALDDSNLTEFVRQLPEKLDFKVTEGGSNLSAGQKQLFCLARALLRRTRILVLDEAMSACDVETDRIIQKTIREKFTHCSLLTIAHRLNTIIDYDRILVLEFGRIRENDSPTNLLSNSGSIFYSLAKEAKIV